MQNDNLKLKIFFIIIMLSLFCFANKSEAATYYMGMSSSGMGWGDGSISHTATQAQNKTTPCLTLQQCMSYMTQGNGDVLIIGDGTYTGDANRIIDADRPPSGISSAWTILKAEHDGEVLFDGENERDMFIIVREGEDLYLKFEGIIWGRPSTSTVTLIGSYVKFLRCGAFDAGNGNTSNFVISRGSSYVLLEDCYAWGSGRYKFIAHTMSGSGQGNIIFRRCVGRLDRANPNHDGRSEPIATFGVYASENVEVQNCISIDGDHSEFWITPSEISGSYSTPSTDGPSINVKYRGIIALNTDMQFGVLSKNLVDIFFADCLGYHLREGAYLRDSASYNHCTFGDFYGPSLQTSTIGFRYSIGDDPVNISSMHNSILFDINGTAINNLATEDYNIFYGNNLNVSNMVPGSHSINENPNLVYLPRIESDNMLLKNTASDGGDKGANILKRIGVSGTLYGEPGYDTVTDENLWPWPYENLIKSKMQAYSYTGPTSSGEISTLSGARGFAASGNGLYGGPITLTSYIWEYLGNPCPPDICNYGAGTFVPKAPNGLAVN